MRNIKGENIWSNASGPAAKAVPHQYKFVKSFTPPPFISTEPGVTNGKSIHYIPYSVGQVIQGTATGGFVSQAGAPGAPTIRVPLSYLTPMPLGLNASIGLNGTVNPSSSSGPSPIYTAGMSLNPGQGHPYPTIYNSSPQYIAQYNAYWLNKERQEHGV